MLIEGTLMGSGATVALCSAVLTAALVVTGCGSSNHAGSAASASLVPTSSATIGSPTESTTPITTPGPLTTPSTLEPTTNASTSAERAQQAREVIAKLIATFAAVLPPGAEPTANGPITETALPLAAGPINLVQSAQWFAVPLPQDEVLAYVAARTSEGLVRFPGVTAIGPNPYVDDVYSGEQTETYDAPIVQVLAASDHGLTSIWINAYTSWRPVRTPAELVASTVSGAHAVSAPGGDYIGATLHLDRMQAQRVAQLLNALDTQRPNAPPCIPGSMYTVTFDGTVETFDIGGCAEVTVRAGETQQPALADVAPADQRSALDAELDSIFGRQIGCSSADILSPTCAATFDSP